MASVHDETDVLRHRSLATTLRQLLRFGVIGLLQNGIGYGLYLILTLAGLPPKPTMTFLYLAGATASFLANRRFTFGHTGKLTHAGIRFMLAHLGGYLINLLLLWWLVDQNGYPHQWVQAGALQQTSHDRQGAFLHCRGQLQGHAGRRWPFHRTLPPVA